MKLQVFLISLCIHAAAFVFMGSFVLHSNQEAHESVSVHLLESVKQAQKPRRNILKPPVRIVVHTNLMNNRQNIIRPAIRHSHISIYVATEVLPEFQYEYAESKQLERHERTADDRSSLYAAEIEISKPEFSNVVSRSSQGIAHIICEQLSKSLSHASTVTLPDYKQPDPSILKDFLDTVTKKIEKSKQYPRWAMDESIEGRVVIRFTILQNGTLCEEILLMNSSGAEILDKAVISAVRDAAPLPALPKELRRERLQVELPMSFHLTRS
jgi:TonB family protein